VKHRTAWLIAIGVLAVLGFTLATLPSAVLSRPLARAGLTATALTGSVWSGTAPGLAWRGAVLGDASWTLDKWPLLRGRAAGHLRLSRSDGELDADFEAAVTGGSISLRDARVDLPIEAFSTLPLGMPKGWRGRVSGSIEELAIAQGWPVALRGQLDFDGLVAPPPRNASVGSFLAVFPHPSPQASLSVPAEPSNLTAKVADKDGPFSVDGQLTLSRARNFAFEGTLAPRGPVPQAMERSLQLLGPADAAGRRQFSVGGTL
jgi:general secretion pathway protein N